MFHVDYTTLANISADADIDSALHSILNEAQQQEDLLYAQYPAFQRLLNTGWQRPEPYFRRNVEKMAHIIAIIMRQDHIKNYSHEDICSALGRILGKNCFVDENPDTNLDYSKKIDFIKNALEHIRAALSHPQEVTRYKLLENSLFLCMPKHIDDTPSHKEDYSSIVHRLVASLVEQPNALQVLVQQAVDDVATPLNLDDTYSHFIAHTALKSAVSAFLARLPQYHFSISQQLLIKKGLLMFASMSFRRTKTIEIPFIQIPYMPLLCTPMPCAVDEVGKNMTLNTSVVGNMPSSDHDAFAGITLDASVTDAEYPNFQLPLTELDTNVLGNSMSCTTGYSHRGMASLLQAQQNAEKE